MQASGRPFTSMNDDVGKKNARHRRRDDGLQGKSRHAQPFGQCYASPRIDPQPDRMPRGKFETLLRG
jgi:hypothetical protein